MMCSDRAGDTSQRCGNSPAFLFSNEFSVPDPSPSVLTFPELGQRLVDSGFSGDPDVAAFLTERIGYTTLRQYCSLIEKSGNLQRDLSALHALVDFDRELRTLFMKWIGIFESQFRSRYANAMALEYGPFAHRDVSHFKNREYFDEFLEVYSREFGYKLEAGNESVRAAFESDGDLPIWRAVEILPFGALSKMYRNTASKAVRFQVADAFRVKYGMLSSWLRTLSEIRNRCAHFSPLVCKPLVARPKRIPGIDADNGGIFYVALLLIQLTQTDALHDDVRTNYDIGFICDMLRLAEPKPAPLLALSGFPGHWKDAMSTASTAIKGIVIKRKPTAHPSKDSTKSL